MNENEELVEKTYEPEPFEDEFEPGPFENDSDSDTSENKHDIEIADTDKKNEPELLPPIPRRPQEIKSENELPKLIENKNNENVIYKPEIYDIVKKKSRPTSVPMSERTLRNRERISKTKENIIHDNLVEKEIEGLNPIESFKQKLIFNQLNTERKRNPKLPKASQIEIKKRYLDKKYKNYNIPENLSPLLKENLKEKSKKSKLKKDSSIVYDPNSEYMKRYKEKMIETDNLKKYVIMKKNEPKQMNLNEIYLFGSDIENIRNMVNRKSVTYDTNFNIAGPEYIGADDQVYELCQKRNYISLPEKYIEYQKYLENRSENKKKIVSNSNVITKNKKDKVELKERNIEKNDKLEIDLRNKNKIEINQRNLGKKDIIEIKEKSIEKKDISNVTKSQFLKKSNRELKTIEKIYNINEKGFDLSHNWNNNKNICSNSKTKKKLAPLRTYLGSYSGYNALSRPAIYRSLIQRHNAHRNKEKFNIEQTILRRLKYILGYKYTDKEHLYLIDLLKEGEVPNDIVQHIFQENMTSLNQLRTELLNQMLNENEIENFTESNEDDSKSETVDNEDNENDISENNENKDIDNNNINNCDSKDGVKKDDVSNEDEKIINKLKSKSISKKIRIFPKTKEPDTPEELLYIIDNYKKINNNKQKDYNRYYNSSYKTNKSNNIINSNKSIDDISENDLKSKSNLNNRTLSYYEILNAIYE